MKRMLIIAVALLLTGCAGFADASPDARLAAACQAYAGTLTALATLKPQMTAGQITAVDRAVAVAGPVCRQGDTITDVPSALVVVAGALGNLATVEGAVK